MLRIGAVFTVSSIFNFPVCVRIPKTRLVTGPVGLPLLDGNAFAADADFDTALPLMLPVQF
jgi:hypothetical protein